MSIRDVKGKIIDKIKVDNVLVSVFDKFGLDDLIIDLMEINPNVRFMSTGGTYKKIREILGDQFSDNLTAVDDYTGFPEMEGGLVKTLHPKIHAGILGERNNTEHQRYLKEELNSAVYIDMLIVNLYPFNQVIQDDDVTFEKARGNIDIGGPGMIRGAAKNFLSCAVVTDPSDYGNLISIIKSNGGCTTFEERFNLAVKAFRATAEYDATISDYLAKKLLMDQMDESEAIRNEYSFMEDG